LMEDMTWFIEGASKSLPVFGWFSANQVDTFRSKSKEKTLGWFGMEKDWVFGDANRKFDKKLNSILKLYDNWDNDDIKQLKGITKSGWDFFAESINRWKQRNWGLSLSTAWKGALEERLKKNARGNFGDDYTNFDDFFKTGKNNKEHRRKLHELMSWGNHANEKSKTFYQTWEAPSYETLLANHYFQPEGDRTD
jgi:hypothetical protein